jgi:hypothetical protein
MMFFTVNGDDIAYLQHRIRIWNAWSVFTVRLHGKYNNTVIPGSRLA